jgi:hypothetical protein
VRRGRAVGGGGLPQLTLLKVLHIKGMKGFIVGEMEGL